MSWSMHVVPLHDLANEGMLDWAASASFSHGVPEEVPDPRPLPTAGDVLAAFTAAGCGGTRLFTVIDEGPVCSRDRELDLGEVGLRALGHSGSDEPLPLTAGVEAVWFRKPAGFAAVTAVCALVGVAGAQLVFDDSADQVFVVRAGEQPADLIADWPW